MLVRTILLTSEGDTHAHTARTRLYAMLKTRLQLTINIITFTQFKSVSKRIVNTSPLVSAYYTASHTNCIAHEREHKAAQ